MPCSQPLRKSQGYLTVIQYLETETQMPRRRHLADSHRGRAGSRCSASLLWTRTRQRERPALPCLCWGESKRKWAEEQHVELLKINTKNCRPSALLSPGTPGQGEGYRHFIKKNKLTGIVSPKHEPKRPKTISLRFFYYQQFSLCEGNMDGYANLFILTIKYMIAYYQ